MDPKHRILKGLYFFSESHHENVNKYVYHMTSRLGVK